MRDLNTVHLRGHLGQDAETRFTSTGKKVTVLNVATNRSYFDEAARQWKDGKIEWHRCLYWQGKGKGQEKAATLKKGDRVQLTGTLTSREFTDKEGIKRQIWEVRVIDLVKVGDFEMAGEEMTVADQPEENISYEPAA